MRKVILSVLVFGLISIGLASGQRMPMPNWIKGTWQNSYSSNIGTSEYLNFFKKGIYIQKGILQNNSKGHSLNLKYRGYKILTSSNDSTYHVSFTKVNHAIEYQFKRLNVEYCTEPVLSYTLIINGIVKRPHSKSINTLFTRL